MTEFEHEWAAPATEIPDIHVPRAHKILEKIEEGLKNKEIDSVNISYKKGTGRFELEVLREERADFAFGSSLLSLLERVIK